MNPAATAMRAGRRPPTAITIEHIRQRDALNALAPEWQRLLDVSTLTSVFLTWEWLSAWLDHYLDPRDELWVLALRDNGRLIGIAPFLRQLEGKRGLPAIRRIRFLGTGEPEKEEVVSEMLDVVSLPGREAEVAAAVAHYLLERAPEWDALYFQDVREDSLLRHRLVPLLRANGLYAAETSEWVDYTARLPASLEEFIGLQPKHHRNQFRRMLRHHGEKKGEFLLLADPSDIDWYYRELIRLHRCRWHSLNQPGIFTTPRVEAFHTAVLRSMLAVKRLHLSLLRFGEDIVSANYIFYYKGVSQQYQGGFDPGFEGVRSPGTLHTLLCIDQDIRAGCHTLDFLKARAGVASYKTRFGCSEAPLFDVTVFSNHAGGKMLRLLYTLRRQAARIKQRLRRRLDKTAVAGSDSVPEKSS